MVITVLIFKMIKAQRDWGLDPRSLHCYWVTWMWDPRSCHCVTCFWPRKSNSQRRQWQPTQVILSGKSHGWRSLVGCSPWGCWESDTTERLHFHFSLSCIGEGNGNALQCSCLENPRDRGAWWAAVYGVTRLFDWCWTRLKQLSSSSNDEQQSPCNGDVQSWEQTVITEPVAPSLAHPAQIYLFLVTLNPIWIPLFHSGNGIHRKCYVTLQGCWQNHCIS